MRRKTISTFLGFILMVNFILPVLSGCKMEADQNHYTVSQWLDRVEDTFNMMYYSETEPLVKSVKTSDENFEAVQIAAEWGLIDPEDDLKFNGKLTKEFAADTLVRAMNCVTPATVDISDKSEVKPLYLENVMSSVNEGIFSLDQTKFDPQKKLTVAEADVAMSVAYDKWINFSYGESFNRSTVKENVINLGGVVSENCEVTEADYSVKYSGDKTFFDENGGYTDNTKKTITFSADQIPEGLEEGSVLAMPADDVVPMDYAVVVTGMDIARDGSVTVTTRNAELEEVYEDIDIQQSGSVDFSEAIFYGPDGKRIDFGGEEAVPMAYKAEDMKSEPLGLYVPGEEKAVETKLKVSNEIDLGEGLSFTLSKSVGSNSAGFGIDLKGEIKAGSDKLEVELGFEDTVTVENRIKTHWDWFKLKVDELRLSLNNKSEETVGMTCSAVANFGKTINKVGDSNGDGKNNIGDWATEGHQLRKIYGMTQTVGQSFKTLSEIAKGATNKKLLDIVIPSTPLHFVVRAELSQEGSIKLTLTQSHTVGGELMNGKLRMFHDASNTKKMDYSAKTELTFNIGFEFQLIGINVADVSAKAGIGAKASTMITSYDKSSNTLLEVCGFEVAAVNAGGGGGGAWADDAGIAGGGNGGGGGGVWADDDIVIEETALKIPEDDTRINMICTEVKVYPILKGYVCSPSSVAGKLFCSLELEILGEDTPFITIHYEQNENGGSVVSECSVGASENYGITTSDKLTLNAETYAVAVDDEADTGLAVATLPKNATIKDIKIKCDNPDVLEVENLMNQATITATPSIKPKVNISAAGGNIKVKDVFGVANEVVDFVIGSWFYADMSGGAKPQFALTGKKNGTANVTVTVNGESVTVPVQVGTGVEDVVSSGALVVAQGTFNLAPGQMAQADFDFIPEDKTISDISFVSDDNSVATVSEEGLIQAVGIGDTIITATLKGKDKEYTTTFTVHVIPEER